MAVLIALAFRLLGGRWFTAALILAAFVAGGYVGAKMAGAAALRAQMRAEAALASARETALRDEIAAGKAAVAALEREKSKAATIAANAARRERDALIALRNAREAHRDITAIFREEPPSAGPCVFRFSDLDRSRLLRIPARLPRPAERPADPAAAGGGVAPLP
jgi:hypothetical protein